MSVSGWLFLLVLRVGLAHEHNEGSLDWSFPGSVESTLVFHVKRENVFS